MQTFTVLLLNGAFATSVSSTLDILSTAASLSRQLGTAKPVWRIASPSGGLIRLSSGLNISTTKLGSINPINDRSVWIIPGLGVTNAASIDNRLIQTDAISAAKSIRAHVDSNKTVAASCSAVFLLERSGCLIGKKITTTWWLAAHLRQRLKTTRLATQVDSEKLLIVDGNVITAGAASAHNDLMLHLIKEYYGEKLAQAVCGVLLFDLRASQAQYAIASVLASVDSKVAELNKRIEISLPNVPSIKDLARAMNMTERTMARHVVAATGLPPSALVKQVRLTKTTWLLEHSQLSVEKIAESVGYADGTALRRMLKKATSATPLQLRRLRQS
jgi:transcriptional regulator GlxA family with amidase domain